MNIPCGYESCFNCYKAGSFPSFFKLPSDYRKAICLKHSRYKNVTKHIVFCENHFYDRNISISRIIKTLIGVYLLKPVDNTICSCN